MSAQTTYSFDMVKGDAGGIYDLAPYEINSFCNEAANGALAFGMGAVTGTKAGKSVKLPTAVTDTFEGIVTNRRTTERDLEGKLALRKGVTVGLMRYGRVWVALGTSVAATYGDAVYLIVSGTDAGKFTNVSTGALAINAKFIGAAENGIAPIELANCFTAGGTEYTLPAATASTLGGVKVGTGLAVTSDGTLSVSEG